MNRSSFGALVATLLPSLFLVLALVTTHNPLTAQGTYAGIDTYCCPNPTVGEHYWSISAEVTVAPNQTLGLSLLENQISSTGQDNGAIIANGLTLVITRASWIADVGVAPNFARWVQNVSTKVLFYGPELVSRFYADEDGGVAVDGNATLALVNQSTVPVSGRLNVSGYWIKTQ